MGLLMVHQHLLIILPYGIPPSQIIQWSQEDYAHTAPGVGITGSWNDLTNTGDPAGNYQPKGYIVEWRWLEILF
jgi:hypothetical protein